MMPSPRYPPTRPGQPQLLPRSIGTGAQGHAAGPEAVPRGVARRRALALWHSPCDGPHSSRVIASLCSEAPHAVLGRVVMACMVHC